MVVDVVVELAFDFELAGRHPSTFLGKPPLGGMKPFEFLAPFGGPNPPLEPLGGAPPPGNPPLGIPDGRVMPTGRWHFDEADPFALPPDPACVLAPGPAPPPKPPPRPPEEDIVEKLQNPSAKTATTMAIEIALSLIRVSSHAASSAIGPIAGT